MGLIGTFEGYVPIATDLYLRDNNIIGFKGDDQQNYKPVRFDAGQITILADGATYHVMNGTFNTTGINKALSINIANINIHTDFLIQFIGWHGNVYRVWLSSSSARHDILLHQFLRN